MSAGTALATNRSCSAFSFEACSAVTSAVTSLTTLTMRPSSSTRALPSVTR